MVNYTSRLKLKRPEGNEPFLRTDFEENWGILDNNPGVAIVPNAASRPAYTPSNAGQLVFEQAEQRLMASSGTGWLPLRQYAQGKVQSYGVNENIGKNGTKYFPPSTQWAFDVSRPHGLLLMGWIRLSQQVGKPQLVDFNFQTRHGGAWTDTGGWGGSSVRFADTGASNSVAASPFPIYGIKPGLAAGTTHVRMKVHVGTVSDDAILFSECHIYGLYLDS